MKKIRLILICFLVFFCMLPDVNTKAFDTMQGCAYFYSPTCSSCIKLGNYIEDNGFSPYVKKYDITQNGNMRLFDAYCEYYDVPEEKRCAPICFYEKAYAVGYESIVKCLDKVNEDVSTPILQVDNRKSVSVDMVKVVFSGLINGINPCSISILFFLLTILVEIDIKYSLKVCYTFLAGKFVMFMLLGTIFFDVLSKINSKVFLNIFEVIFMIICVLFCFGNLYDAVMAKSGRVDKIKIKLPKVLILQINTYIKKVMSLHKIKYILPLCFFLGVGVSCGEFLCTGQIYLSTIVSLILEGERISWYGVFMLFVYDVAYIIPLIICSNLVYKGVKVLKLSQLFVEKLWIVKIINALLFLGFFVYMLINNIKF